MIKEDNDDSLNQTFGHPQKKKICAEYSSIVSTVRLEQSLLGVFITIVNFILRTVCIKLVDWIGYPTETEKLKETTKVTFAVQFFNTAILILLVNADLSE